jgi:hypothetical protein
VSSHADFVAYGNGEEEVRDNGQGIGVYFQVPRNDQVTEEILTTKSKKEGKKGPANKNLFDFFDFAVNFFFKTPSFERSSGGSGQRRMA